MVTCKELIPFVVYDGHDEGVCDGPDEVADLPNEVGNGTSRVTDTTIERATNRAADEENDKLDDDLRSLDDFDDEEVGGQPRNFSKTKYHEFDLVCDMANPIFKIGMEFGSAYVFRKTIMAHAIKRMRNIKFQKNDPNRVKAICKDKCCNWFVFAYWLGDHKTFKIESMLDAHNCAMSFKNTFVNSKMIVDRYLDKWRERPEWNFTRISQHLRTDTNVDTSIWQYYRARTRAKELIQ
ncbi:hypothetical protein LWI28_006323 [Acer negundo]|uniref:Transposase MuDR plant domain-containing protein n=1 Tax=Acer negundo TaxID=4023 RepID=A0AAD5J8C1_ACENE|nr:hypothetical protein LWI28_006323 [Acer negundo]